MSTTFIVIITSTLSILLGFLSASVTAYFKSKGQNLAILEDQGKLTQIAEDIKKGVQKEVESVKGEIQKETEKVKAELAVMSNRKNTLFGEEKENLLKFYYAFSSYYIIVSNMTSKILNSNYNIYELMNESERAKEFEKPLIEYYSRLELFIDSSELLAASENLVNSVIECTFFYSNTFGVFDTNNKMIDVLRRLKNGEVIEGFSEGYFERVNGQEMIERNQQGKLNSIDSIKKFGPEFFNAIEEQKNSFIIQCKKYLKEGA